MYVAKNKGYFDEVGLEVDIITTPGADKVMAALLSKDAQIGLMGPEATVYVYQNGQNDYAINFAQLTQKDGSFLLGRDKVDTFSSNFDPISFNFSVSRIDFEFFIVTELILMNFSVNLLFFVCLISKSYPSFFMKYNNPLLIKASLLLLYCLLFIFVHDK